MLVVCETCEHPQHVDVMDVIQGFNCGACNTTIQENVELDDEDVDGLDTSVDEPFVDY